MLEHKANNTVIKCTSSYIGYQNDECIIACAIVNRNSNEKEDLKVLDNSNVMDVLTPALHKPKEMPMLGFERRSAR